MNIINIEEPFPIEQIKKMLKKDSLIICSKENKNKYKKILSEMKAPYFVSVLTLEELFKKDTSELKEKLKFLKIIIENQNLKNLNLFKIEILDELFEIYKEQKMNELVRTKYTSEILNEIDSVIKIYEEENEDIAKLYDKDLVFDEDIYIVDVFFETKKELKALLNIKGEKNLFFYGNSSKFIKNIKTELNINNVVNKEEEKAKICFSANDPYEELLIAVNKIEKIKRENHLSYDDFAICSNNLDQYVGYLDLIFKSNNLNYNIPKEINNNLIDNVLKIVDKSTNIYNDVLIFLQKNVCEDANTILNLIDNFFEIFEEKEILKEFLEKMKNKKVLVEYNNSVDIIDFSKLLNTHYKYIFFLGASEGSMSYKYSKKVLLNDIEKSKAYLNYDSVKKINKFELQLFDLENRAYSISYHKVNNEKAKQKPSKLIENEEELKIEDYKYLVNSLKPKLSRFQEIPNLNKQIKKAKNIFETKTIKKEFSKLKLSASKTENFNNCHFSYFCNYDLNLRTFEEKFDLALIGNFIHKLFEAKFSIETNIETVKADFSKNLKSKKEIFLLEKIFESFPALYEKIEKELLDNEYIVDKREYNIKENPLFIKDNELEIELSGIIDRIDVKDNLIRIVDYKTGNVKIDLDAYLNGLKMQLFIYMLYASSKFEKTLAGIFYQKAFLDSKKEEDIKKYLLNGIILHEEEVIESMGGNNIENYLNIHSYAKIDPKKAFSEKTIKKINKFTEKLLLETGKNILRGKIDINPYKDPESCKFCDYASICGIEKNSKIFRKIQKQNFLEVVGEKIEMDE